MRGISKKILLAGFVAVFAFIVTIGSTYAWFNITNVGGMDEVTLNVKAEDSLLILLDDKTNPYNLVDDATFLNNPANYKTTLTPDDLAAANYSVGTVIMTPITTLDGEAFTTRGLVSVTEGYVEISFWVMSQSKNANIGVRDFYISASNTNPDKDIVIDTVRLSVDGGTGGTVSIYGNDKDYLFNDGSGSANTAAAAFNQKYYKATGANETDNTATLSSVVTAFDLVADTPEKVTIRIWIEGWDGDCNNSMLGAVFDVGFSFFIKL